jgi:DNA invertase Pin-like site-specific DNA recombinase
MDAGVEFSACDLPEASRLLLHIMAAVAENEARAISGRTCVALAAAKARGTILGATNPSSRNLTDDAAAKGRVLGAQAVKANADAFYAEVAPIIRELRDQGLSLSHIATRLDAEGYRLRSGAKWNAVQVSRILQRRFEV